MRAGQAATRHLRGVAAHGKFRNTGKDFIEPSARESRPCTSAELKLRIAAMRHDTRPGRVGHVHGRSSTLPFSRGYRVHGATHLHLRLRPPDAIERASLRSLLSSDAHLQSVQHLAWRSRHPERRCSEHRHHDVIGPAGRIPAGPVSRAMPGLTERPGNGHDRHQPRLSILLRKSPCKRFARQDRLARILTTSQPPMVSHPGSRHSAASPPHEYICKISSSVPDSFKLNPIHQMPGLNT